MIFIFHDIFQAGLYVLMAMINFQSFYKQRKTYNMLFGIFFGIELLRVYCLLKYLPPNINISIEFIEGAILIVAIVLFCRNKFKLNNY